MKRLALVLAAVGSIGSGCYGGTTCSRTITLDWSAGFTTADGGTVGCSTSSPTIQFIDVWVNDQYVTSFDCSAARGTVGIPSGSNLITVEAVHATSTTDAIIYRDEFNTDTSACGNQAINTYPAEGRVIVDYSFSPVNACVSPGPSFIWVKVRDDIAHLRGDINHEIAADSTFDPEQFTCGSTVSFRLAIGSPTLSHTLLWTQEMIRGAVAGTYQPVATDCADYSIVVSPAAATHVAPVLVDSSAACL